MLLLKLVLIITVCCMMKITAEMNITQLQQNNTIKNNISNITEKPPIKLSIPPHIPYIVSYLPSPDPSVPPIEMFTVLDFNDRSDPKPQKNKLPKLYRKTIAKLLHDSKTNTSDMAERIDPVNEAETPKIQSNIKRLKMDNQTETESKSNEPEVRLKVNVTTTEESEPDNETETEFKLDDTTENTEIADNETEPEFKSNDRTEQPQVVNNQTETKLKANDTTEQPEIADTETEFKSNDTTKQPQVANNQTETEFKSNDTTKQPEVTDIETEPEFKANDRTEQPQVANNQTETEFKSNDTTEQSEVADNETEPEFKSNERTEQPQVVNNQIETKLEVNDTTEQSEIRDDHIEIEFKSNGTIEQFKETKLRSNGTIEQQPEIIDNQIETEFKSNDTSSKKVLVEPENRIETKFKSNDTTVQTGTGSKSNDTIQTPKNTKNETTVQTGTGFQSNDTIRTPKNIKNETTVQTGTSSKSNDTIQTPKNIKNATATLNITTTSTTIKSTTVDTNDPTILIVENATENAPVTESTITITESPPPTTISTTTESPWIGITTVEHIQPTLQTAGLHAKAGEFKWRVLLSLTDGENTLVCGGAIVSHHSILTTATCLYNSKTGKKFKTATIHGGSRDSTRPGFTIVVNLLQSSLIHPNFNISDPNLTHNIAIISIMESFPVSSTVGPIEIADKPPKSISDKLYMPGFGRDLNGVTLKTMKYQLIKLLPNYLCRIVYGINVCNKYIFTTYGQNTYAGSICRVESGAPVSYHRGFFFRPKLVGLASFVSKNGCGKGYPDGHVNVAAYYWWIKTNI